MDAVDRIVVRNNTGVPIYVSVEFTAADVAVWPDVSSDFFLIGPQQVVDGWRRQNSRVVRVAKGQNLLSGVEIKSYVGILGPGNPVVINN